TVSITLLVVLFGCKEEPGNPNPPPADTTVSYTHHIRPIFNSDCVSCHSDRRPSGGLDLSTYEALRAGGISGDPVVPGQPDSSLLIQSVDGTMTSHIPYFTYPAGDTSLVLLRRWVAQGALNN
ncbi:MAG: c-type cytochrome domain-containing protein, partial [candidate division WOR-3 bacterium]